MLLRSFSLGFVFLAFSANASAAEAKVNQQQPVSNPAIPGEKTESTFFLSAGPGLAMHGGNLGWAINFGALSQMSGHQNLFYGLDAGLNFWSFQAATAPIASISTSATGVQLLPTVLYRFEIAGPSIFPYIGLSVGPNLYLERQSLGGGTQTNTTLYLESLVRPGFFTQLGKTVSLQVEAKFGLLGTNFIFLPQANVVFAL